MHINGDRTRGFTCDVARGRVTIFIHERAREDEPRAAYRWEATIVCHPSGRALSGDGDAPYVTFWTAANAYASAPDRSAFPTVDWNAVADALQEVGVSFS
jgi:hypothetical protein